jgi:hypothetical protein
MQLTKNGRSGGNRHSDNKKVCNDLNESKRRKCQNGLCKHCKNPETSKLNPTATNIRGLLKPLLRIAI